ncbi:MAG TPA: serine/threonine protein kinase, partial [Deltaproteobacteria bacterium]|nr:serine/threonine protein kinase [Deltaproteobacteria bacterium]
MEPARQRQFRIHHCLGRGGYGEVYRATMMSPGGISSDVALKMLRLDVDTTGDAVGRLRDEGKLLSALRHPTILRVHDIAVLEGRIGLVTEYIEGQDLSSLVRIVALPPRALLQVVGAVAEALDVAWCTLTPEGGRPLHLIHRDIKPSNIRLGRHGQVKLLDFGIARSVSGELTRESRTGTGSAIGSLSYMAPERFGRDPVGSAADVYGLGCTLYEGLSGVRLFPDPVPVEMFRLAADPKLHATHIREALADLPPRLSAGVIALLSRCLEHDPVQRPTAAEVAATCDSLADVLEGPTLKRWARERQWPEPEPVPGHFDGRTITEGTLSDPSLRQTPSLASRPSETYDFELPDTPTARDRVGSTAVLFGVGGLALSLLYLGIFQLDPPAARPRSSGGGGPAQIVHPGPQDPPLEALPSGGVDPTEAAQPKGAGGASAAGEPDGGASAAGEPDGGAEGAEPDGGASAAGEPAGGAEGAEPDGGAEGAEPDGGTSAAGEPAGGASAAAEPAGGASAAAEPA